MERLISKFRNKWLGVPKSLTNVALNSLSTKLKLPTKSLVEEFKLDKARLFQMLHNSVDPLGKSAQPAIIIGRKWDAKYAVETAESSLKKKEVNGLVATGRARLSLYPQQWWSKETTKNKRRMVSEEIHHFEENKRLPIAVAQPKQDAWTRWNRTITWNDLKKMEPKQLSFLIKAVYDILPTPVNLKFWGLRTSDLCKACGNIANLKHVLTGCLYSRRSFMWRHNEILGLLLWLQKCIVKLPIKSHLEDGNISKTPLRNRHKPTLLDGCKDWRVIADVDRQLAFPTEITLTHQRPDFLNLVN